MKPETILVAAGLTLIGLLAVLWWRRQVRARECFLATIKTIAEGGRNEIGGQPVQYWLDILNQHTSYPIAAGSAMVLRFEGQDFFFVDGAIAYVALRYCAGKYNMSCGSRKAFLLVAVGRSAVKLLAENEGVFRRIAGSTELAAFSIYQWLRFARMLGVNNEVGSHFS